MAENTQEYQVTMQRVDTTHYRARNSQGAEIEFGRKEGLFTPVELLLAALAGCASVDVDVVTSRRVEPEEFTVVASAAKISSEQGRHLSDVRLDFSLRFADTPEGRRAQQLIPRLLKASHDHDCTLSQTLERPTEVEFIYPA